MVKDVHDARVDLEKRPRPAIPAGEGLSYDKARAQSKSGQRKFWEGLKGKLASNRGEVQAGHTMDVKAASEANLPRAYRDAPETMMALHSRVDDNLKVESVHGNAGSAVPQVSGKNATPTMERIDWSDANTRHTGQEKLIGDARVRSTAGDMTPDEIRGAQKSASREVLWRTDNTPWDQRNVAQLREGAAIVGDAKASTKMARVRSKLTKAGKLFAAALPVLGVALTTASNAQAATTLATSDSAVDKREAALDLAGNIPVAGDLLDAARGGFALGEAAGELMVDQELAMRHGDAAKGLAMKAGLPEDFANVVGGVAAAGSALVQFATWSPFG